MRAWIWIAGMLVAMIAVEQCPAQTTNRAVANNRTFRTGPTASTTSGFNLTNMLQRFRSRINARGSVPGSNVPNPNSPEYLKAFGFKRL
jgi:hypothetical protein